MCRNVPNKNNTTDGHAKTSVIVVLKSNSENRWLNTPSYPAAELVVLLSLEQCHQGDSWLLGIEDRLNMNMDRCFGKENKI